MIFTFENYKLDVDVEKTREYYETEKAINEKYHSSASQNFIEAVKFLPQEATSFFNELGVDIKKPNHAYILNRNDDGTMRYSGTYQLCAKLAHSNGLFVDTEQYQSYHYKTKTFPIADGFEIDFSESVWDDEVDYWNPNSNAPSPAVLMSFSVNLKWVLAEEYDYYVDRINYNEKVKKFSFADLAEIAKPLAGLFMIAFSIILLILSLAWGVLSLRNSNLDREVQREQWRQEAATQFFFGFRDDDTTEP